MGNSTAKKPKRKAAKIGRRTKPNLDSVLSNIEADRQVGLTRETCENIENCGFNGDNLALAIVATDILYDEQPISLRGLMYQVVSAGWLPATDREHYTRLGRIMTRLRELGIVPFAWIVDGVRSTNKPGSWSGLADFGEAVRHSYRLDFWARLPHYIHFIVEKDAVSSTIVPVTRESDVSLSPIRGYSSLSFAHEIASQWNRIEKPIFCYFAGDFDASGFDLQRDIQEKLKRYSNKTCWYGDGCEGDLGIEHDGIHRMADESEDFVLFRRFAVVDRDFEDFNLLPLSVKDSDKRARKFREQRGDRCAELDAIPSTELRRRVREIIESHIDVRRDEWERLQRVEAAEKETLDNFVASLSGDVA